MLWHGIVGLCCPLGKHTMLSLGQNKMIMMHTFPLLLSSTSVLHVRNTPMITMSSTHITRLFNLITSLKMRPWRKFSLLSSYNINWIYSCHYITIIHLMQFWCSARQRRTVVPWKGRYPRWKTSTHSLITQTVTHFKQLASLPQWMWG